MGDLKPCPFCGGQASRQDVPCDNENDPNWGGTYIECDACGACSAVHFGRKENLEDCWNRRATTAEAEVARLREALEKIATATPVFSYVMAGASGALFDEPGSPYDRGKKEGFDILSAIARAALAKANKEEGK